MKKLMIAAAIVCAAVASHAAMIEWDITDCYTFAGASGTSTTMIGEEANYALYFFAESGDFTRSSAIEAFKGGDTSFVANGIETPWADVGEYYNEGGNWTAGSTQKAFYMLFNNADATKADYAFVGDLQDVAMPGSGISGSFSDSAAASASGANWTAAAIPEPTSGLLLLLGVAGLALKRRRA